MLNDYKIPAHLVRCQEAESEGMAFVQDGESPKQRGPTCWHCNKKGHAKSDCPELKIGDAEVGVDNLNINDCDQEHGLIVCNDLEHNMVQKGDLHGVLNPKHLYIDTCATYASTPYPELLTNINTGRKGLIGHGNAGSTFMKETGDLSKLKKYG